MNKFHIENGIMPTRGTAYSAGYDFYATKDIVIPPNGHQFFDTGVRVELDDNKFMQLSIRSSLGKKGVMLSNSIGVIDSDYFGTGETIKGMLYNTNDRMFTISKGDRFMQGVILPYITVSNDLVRSTARKGGLGSTGK